VKYRWKILPAPEKGGIKNYIVGLVIKLSSDAETLEAQKLLLDKLNLLLVQVRGLLHFKTVSLDRILLRSSLFGIYIIKMRLSTL
tara:strand:- start:827 stop:1081 length:255 start_codon:yes stop_codon:yes gene_type:complete